MAETGEAEVLPEQTERRFGTFGGVFTPTLLTILGVILYLRLGWVVGNAGLVGAVAIILIAFGITAFTALSLSSITTNIRIGAGGAYSIISQSLGIEVGGSIGLPLYLSQALAVAMYIFGFRAGWLSLFPSHPAILVDFAVFGVLFGLAFVSAKLAFKIQYAILAIIVASIASVVWAGVTGSMVEPVTLLGSYPGAPETGFQGTDFWFVFAVFFPAATGIMAGANMSGELENPRRSIPAGTLGAIAVSLVIYLGLAYWLATSVPVPEIVSNYTALIDRAAFSPAVLAGLLAATFSSALVSLVGAPRILQALGVHRILPGSDRLARTSRGGEPRNAMWVTGGLVALALLLRDLNAIAPLITMFFLITYMMLNVVLLVEQNLGLVSFRPLMAIPWWVPLGGTVGCVLVMFIINPVVGLGAVVVVGGIYGYLTRKTLDAPYGDVRSGLFVALAEWAARKVGGLGGGQERAWKPKLLVPVDDPRSLHGEYLFLRAIAHPTGTVTLLGITPTDGPEDGMPALETLKHAFRDDDVYASVTTLGSESFTDGVIDAMQALRAAFFRPNILFLPLRRVEDDEMVSTLAARARGNGLGVAVFGDHQEAGLGRRRRIKVWVPDRQGRWGIGEDLEELDLAVLVAMQIHRTWQGSLRLAGTVEDPDDADRARAFLSQMADLARIPRPHEPVVEVGPLEEVVHEGQDADLHVIPVTDDVDPVWMRRVVDRADAACVFTLDSGDENALA